VQELAPAIGIVTACVVLGLARAAYYRCLRPRPSQPRATRPSPPRALSAPQRQQLLEVLHGERFVDRAPAEVYATLLDEGVRHCSVRTMYRVLAAAGEVRERRNQRVHPAYANEPALGS
jgi:putative transposase